MDIILVVWILHLSANFYRIICSSLGMCKRCGDLKMIACSQCKGVGSVKTGKLFGFSLMGDLFQSLGDGQVSTSSTPCMKCQSKGCVQCPDCSKLW